LSIADEGNPLMDDRRDALRQHSKVETLTIEHETVGLVEAKVLDISRRGLRLLLPRVIPCGDEITLHSPPGMDLFMLRATIVRQTLVTRGDTVWFECGVKVSDTATWRHIWFLTLRTNETAQSEPAARAA